MIFTTPWFLFFSTIVFAGVWLFHGFGKGKSVAIITSSIVFYWYFSGLDSLTVITLLAAGTYAAGMLAPQEFQWRYVLLVAIAANIAALLYFKYTSFFLDTILGALASDADNRFGPAFVPLGISFFVFEFCHYLVDVYRGAAPVRNPLHFGVFAFFYPRLAAGPILRFQMIVPQVSAATAPSRHDYIVGLSRIIVGFCKKFLIADTAANLINDDFSISSISSSTDAALLCILLYARIYADFSAYSDMAIGLARLWGIQIPENFRFPIFATSPSAFWRRWHISLSTWVRDYIYIALGGGRRGPLRKLANLLIAMALCGLWHGAAWRFVLWGVIHGVFLSISHVVTDWVERLKPYLYFKRSRPVAVLIRGGVISLGWAATQTAVALAWLPFFYSVHDTLFVLSKLVATNS